MAQLMTIQLSKGDSPNLGFRLQGGTDFAAPLIIQKVNGGSPAEKSGLIAGDAVVKINNTDVFNLRHKDAQDVIVKAGPSFTLTVQRGGSTWKPSVTPTGSLLQQGSISPVTKTSLAAKPQPSIGAIGTGHNLQAKPFLNGNANGGPRLVNKQYNSPVGLYSEQSIAETLSAQSEVLSTGVLGVNFKKNEKNYDATKSAVYSMLKEDECEPRRIDSEEQQQHQQQQQQQQAPPSALKHFQAPENKPQAPTAQLPPGQNICADCERLIVGVFVRIKDKNLHVECFKCSTCGASLKNVGYYNINHKLYCDIHAKLAAKSNPPGPNLVPVTLPPSAKAPAGTISAALASHSLPSPGPISPRGGPLSPNPNLTAAPFQSGTLANQQTPQTDSMNNEALKLKRLTLLASKKSSASVEGIDVLAKDFEPTKPNYLTNANTLQPTQLIYDNIKYEEAAPNYTTAPRPFSSVSAPLSPSNYASRPLPKTPYQGPPAPAPAPIQAPIQPASTPGFSPKPAGGLPKEIKCYNIVWPPQQEAELPTASPLYFPPPSQVHIPEHHFDPIEADYSELEDYTNSLLAMDPKMSMCSSEVCNITGRKSAVECASAISEYLDTKMLVENIMKSRPKSPPPLEDISVTIAKKEEQIAQSVAACPCAQSCCNEKCPSCPLREPAELKRPIDYQANPKIQNAVPQRWESAMVTALSADPFAHIPQKQSHSAFASALSIAPSEPFHPVQPVFTTMEPVALPEETVPYFPPEHPIIPAEPKPIKEEIDKPSTPFVEALKIAPDRPFTPVGGAAPVKKKKQQPDPLFKDLPKPHEILSMRDALTVTPDRSFTPNLELTPSSVVEQKETPPPPPQPRRPSIKQPTPQPFISSMVNTFEGSGETVTTSSFPPVSIEIQQSSDYHADYEEVKSELSQQIMEQHKEQHVHFQEKVECHECKMREEHHQIAKQNEEIIMKKPMNLTSALHKSEYIPQYQTSLEYDEEIQLPHHKNINKLLQPKSKIIPDTRPLVRQQMNTPPQITKPVTTVQPGQIQHTFQPVHDDFVAPNSAFSQRVAKPDTPSKINKPPSAIPYYQQNLVASEFLAPDVNVFDPKSPATSRSPSPCLGIERSSSPFKRASPRAKSPAAGPPPNPLKKHEDAKVYQQDFKVEKAKESLTNYIPHHREAMTNIMIREDKDRVEEQSMIAGSNFQQQNYMAQSHMAQDMQKQQKYQAGNMEISMSEKKKLEHDQALKQQETKSIERTEHETEIVYSNDKVEITTKTFDINGDDNFPIYNEINVTIPLPISSSNSSYTSCNSSPITQTTLRNNYLETAFPSQEEIKNSTNLIIPVSSDNNNNNCNVCHVEIRGPFISALGKIWCPEHFTCATASCKRPLQDIGFVEEQGQLHCEYCFEQYLAPNCCKCSQKIKGDCLKAIGKNFHPECFNCSYCGKLFGNSPFFLEDGLPYCETDWNEMFTTKCFACGFPVEAGDRWVEALNNNYHSQCFNCTMCKKNLEGQSFFAKGGRPFCKNHAR